MHTDSPVRPSGPAVATPAERGAAPVGGGHSDGRPRGSRAPRWARRHRPLYVGWRVGVFVAGLAVVVAGVIMLPLPGPGWLVIFAGMALWGTEFTWAQRVLGWTRRRVAEAARRAMDPRVRRRNIALLAAGVAVCAAALTGYLYSYGVVLPWEIGG